MTDDELRDALDGLYAYDVGATDSGIRDEALRERCKAALEAMSPAALSQLVSDMWLTPQARAAGYNALDAEEFTEWLADEMGVRP